MKHKYLFTSEQVSCGHPDKMCDLISDFLLDAYMKQDKYSRVAIETLIKDYNIVVAGEVTSNAKVNIGQTVVEALKYVGVDNIDKYVISNLIAKQSSDIALGVDAGGAGDQGIMFGYACRETENYMPLAHAIATRALIKLRELKHPLIKPDAKSQVTFDYAAERIDTFLISTQHSEDISHEDLFEVVHGVMVETAKEFNLNTDFKALVNPTGRFVIGGSIGDAGVTGRKIICDTYGGYARHGGGAFSGKDPTKVDRSAAYMARYLAIYVCKTYGADFCEIQLSYGIGIKEPFSVCVTTDLPEERCHQIAEFLQKVFDLTPAGIIDFLKLRDISYKDTTCYGHFGKPGLPWECY